MGPVLMKVPDPSVHELLALPHLRWEDLGPERTAELGEGARSLALRTWSLRAAPIRDRAALERDVRRHAELVEEAVTYLRGASSSSRSALVSWTERMYVALDRHGEHASGADPFQGLEETADPPAHLDPGMAPAWPFLLGRLAAAAEEDLGWRVRRRRVDLRTWAFLVWMAYVWSRRSFPAARRALRDLLEAAGGLELNRDGLLAGAALLVNQRAVVMGYREAVGGSR